MPKKNPPRIEAFDFEIGRLIASKYEVIEKLGQGWEAEVYLLRERLTGIERAGKFFFPHRNLKNKTVLSYAKKLHKLAHCPILIQYHTQETITFRQQPITFLVSEYVDGARLSDFLAEQPGKRLQAFQALHLLHALAIGLECIHRWHEYHGDLHSDNVIVQRYGLGFELKLLDLFHWSMPKRDARQDDIVDIIKIFYEALGGQRHYAKQPVAVKQICCGLKRSLILKRYPTVRHLRAALEDLQW